MTLNDVGVSGWPIASITASANKLQLTLPSDFGMQKMDFVLRNGALVGKWVEPNQTEAASVILKKTPGREPDTEKRILIDGPAGKIGASIILPNQASTLSYKAHMDYDPIPAIKSLKVPYLAILAGEDESIDAMETREILEQLKKPNISIKWYAGYDHPMRKTGKKGEQLRFPGHPANYFEDQARFISTF